MEFKCRTCTSQETDPAEGPDIGLNCKPFEFMKFCRLGDIIGANRNTVDSVLAKKRNVWSKFMPPEHIESM